MRAYRLDILDGVYNDFHDEMGLRQECEHSRTLGMDGKTLIHPSQVRPCNEIFSPTAEEIDWSRKIIRAFAEPENAKKGVIVVDSRMVERCISPWPSAPSPSPSKFARWSWLAPEAWPQAGACAPASPKS